MHTRWISAKKLKISRSGKKEGYYKINKNYKNIELGHTGSF